MITVSYANTKTKIINIILFLTFKKNKNVLKVREEGHWEEENKTDKQCLTYSCKHYFALHFLFHVLAQ